MRMWIQTVNGNYYQVPDQQTKAMGNKNSPKEVKSQSVLEDKGILALAKQNLAHCLCKLNKRHYQ